MIATMRPICPITQSSICKILWPVSPASARSLSTGPALTACGFGWIPNKLQDYSLTTLDVVNAIQGQNVQVVAGQLGGPPVPPNQALPIHRQRPGPPGRRGAIRKHHHQEPPGGRSGPNCAHQGRRPGRAEPTDLSALLPRSTAIPAAHMPIFLLPGANALTVAKESTTSHGGNEQGLPARNDLRDPLRHHHFVKASHSRCL